jgi:hypothetical protein
MSGLGILNLRALAFLPWQVSQPNLPNSSLSNSWKATFIRGTTTSFMYLPRSAAAISFHGFGGPATLAAGLSSAAARELWFLAVLPGPERPRYS